MIYGGFEVKKDLKFFLKLFASTFYLSAFTFGGGYVIVPLMRKKFVEELRWIEENEMLDLIAIAQSTPGAIAINTSILAGYRLAGVIGSIVTVLGSVTPPLIIISIVSIGYTAFRDSQVVSMLLKGMQAGVAAVIASVVIGMAKAIIKQKRWLSIAIMILVFVITVFLKFNVVFVILSCGIIGIIDMLYTSRKAKTENGGME